MIIHTTEYGYRYQRWKFHNITHYALTFNNIHTNGISNLNDSNHNSISITIVPTSYGKINIERIWR